MGEIGHLLRSVPGSENLEVSRGQVGPSLLLRRVINAGRPAYCARVVINPSLTYELLGYTRLEERGLSGPS